MKAIEQWMTTYAKTDRGLGVSQIYIKYDEPQKLVLLVFKATGDILLAGTQKTIKQLYDPIKSKFEIQRTIIDNRISFYSFNITQQK